MPPNDPRSGAGRQPAPTDPERMSAVTARPPESPRFTPKKPFPPHPTFGRLPLIKVVPAPDVVVAGKFKLERPLRRGAMGSVWIARHLDLDIPVALKLMLADTPESGESQGPPTASESQKVVLKRFEREAKSAAQLRSANVVRILDFGRFEQVPYIVMELLEGEDLSDRLRREGVMRPAQVARILVPIARALHVAHESGLVHRDLKPGNIFLAKEGLDEVPKILDFGVARSRRPEDADGAEEKTASGLLLGTPAYMSPEQAIGRDDVDHRADIWSLGVIAFRALSGEKPFPGPGTVETIVQIVSNPIPRLSAAVPTIDPELDAIVHKCLRRDRNERFQSARDIARGLTPFLPKAFSSRPPPAEMSTPNELPPMADCALKLFPPPPRGVVPPPPSANVVSKDPLVPATVGEEVVEATPQRSKNPARATSIALAVAGMLVAITGIVAGAFILRRPAQPSTTLVVVPAVSSVTPVATEVANATPPASAFAASPDAASTVPSSTVPSSTVPSSKPPIARPPLRPPLRPPVPPKPKPKKPVRDLGY